MDTAEDRKHRVPACPQHLEAQLCKGLVCYLVRGSLLEEQAVRGNVVASCTGQSPGGAGASSTALDPAQALAR